ncbi:hypothetical protein B0H10DRAFT_2119102 [Mycena sp. CBHHK59/15]|nr:hypothetical protein B0H10DRAFT_2119102 [Mycena sp. CBHHK59/15]
MRTLAPRWDGSDVGACQSLWTGFFMAEVLSATAMQPMSLLQLVDSVQTCGPPAGHTIFNIMHPYMYHVTRFARVRDRHRWRAPLLSFLSF